VGTATIGSPVVSATADAHQRVDGGLGRPLTSPLGDLDRHVHHDLVVVQRDRYVGRHPGGELGLARTGDDHHPPRAELVDLCCHRSGRLAGGEADPLRQRLVRELHGRLRS
jgi:hypothetical protein